MYPSGGGAGVVGGGLFGRPSNRGTVGRSIKVSLSGGCWWSAHYQQKFQDTLATLTHALYVVLAARRGRSIRLDAFLDHFQAGFGFSSFHPSLHLD